MKIVMAFGTFDIFHPGHENYLRQAKALGTRLVVVVARDENVVRYKKQDTRNKEQKRLEIIRASGLADEAVLGDLENRYAAIEKFRPGVIALGYDQKANLEELKNKLQELGLQVEIVRLEAFQPEKWKSSKLK